MGQLFTSKSWDYPTSTQTWSCRFSPVPLAPHLDGVAFYGCPQQLVNQPLSLIDRWKSHGLDTPVACSRPTANQPQVQTLSSRRLRRKEATQSNPPWFEVVRSGYPRMQLAPLQLGSRAKNMYMSWIWVSPCSWTHPNTFLWIVKHPIHSRCPAILFFPGKVGAKSLGNAGNDGHHPTKILKYITDHTGVDPEVPSGQCMGMAHLLGCTQNMLW